MLMNRADTLCYAFIFPVIVLSFMLYKTTAVEMTYFVSSA